jgi:hypothetical protein
MLLLLLLLSPSLLHLCPARHLWWSWCRNPRRYLSKPRIWRNLSRLELGR